MTNPVIPNQAIFLIEKPSIGTSTPTVTTMESILASARREVQSAPHAFFRQQAIGRENLLMCLASSLKG